MNKAVQVLIDAHAIGNTLSAMEMRLPELQGGEQYFTDWLVRYAISIGGDDLFSEHIDEYCNDALAAVDEHLVNSYAHFDQPQLEHVRMKIFDSIFLNLMFDLFHTVRNELVWFKRSQPALRIQDGEMMSHRIICLNCTHA